MHKRRLCIFCKCDKDQIQLKYDTLRLLYGCRRSALLCLGHWLCRGLAAFTARVCLAVSPELALSDALCRVNLHIGRYQLKMFSFSLVIVIVSSSDRRFAFSVARLAVVFRLCWAHCHRLILNPGSSPLSIRIWSSRLSPPDSFVAEIDHQGLKSVCPRIRSRRSALRRVLYLLTTL